MLHVAVLFLNGGCASTAVLPMEIFHHAGVLWNLLNGVAPSPQFRVTTASIDGRPAVTDHLVSLTPSCSMDAVEKPDIVFVPAGGSALETLAHSDYAVDAVLSRNAAVVPRLRHWADGGARIAAVCSGVALLAEAGLLDGKRASTHWGLADACRNRFPNVDWRTEYLITDAGDIFCGGGINSATDLSLYLVERFGGRDLALECARALLIEMPRAWQVASHAALERDHDDHTIQRAQNWMHEHFQRTMSMEAIAAQVGMSPRNFIRRFKGATGHTPLHYIHTIRIDTAKRMLERGRQTIQEVSQAVGYEDVIFFRDLFKRHTGLCPAEYRNRFCTSRVTSVRNRYGVNAARTGH